MGWKRTMRSLAAAAGAAERDAQRRHKIALKEQMIADAEDAVADWEDYVDNLISVHVDLADAMNWHKIAQTPKPAEPVRSNEKEDAAQAALEEFTPGLFDFLVGGSAKKKQKLVDKLAVAPAEDTIAYENVCAAYERTVAEWESETDLARRLMEGDEDAIAEVIKEFQAFEKEALIGSAVSFSIKKNFVHAMPEVHGEDIIPKYRRKQLASGKLSETKMPTGQFNELYQDYVCSVALKVAGDMFHILPLDEIYVTCQLVMLNSATGHQELTPILSVQFVRETFAKLNLKSIDPSDSMANFNHVMSFKKTKGFAAIEPLQPLKAD